LVWFISKSNHWRPLVQIRDLECLKFEFSVYCGCFFIYIWEYLDQLIPLSNHTHFNPYSPGSRQFNLMMLLFFFDHHVNFEFYYFYIFLAQKSPFHRNPQFRSGYCCLFPFYLFPFFILWLSSVFVSLILL
jgi:hypothetical protein